MYSTDENKLLEEAVEKIVHRAKELGLDFYDMNFEICPADIIYTFGAYAMPTRFSHWTFGKAYQRMKTHYDYNLSRIYELVINSDPCYAFLLEGNSLIQNKMIIAHVLAHCDFFKNNAFFRHTSRRMVESMAGAADRFREYEFKYGKYKVEAFLDSVLAIREHVDPYLYIKDKKDKVRADYKSELKEKNQEGPYSDLWSIGSEDKGTIKNEMPKKIPAQPQKDLLLFIMNYARDLEDWQRDIISVVRDEMLYFWPQMETKIMNEGWASYWHLRIIRDMDLTEEEAIEFSKMHAGVAQPGKMTLNPYYLGLKIFEDIERRWNNPTKEEREKFHRKGSEGRKKIFEVRETENDISFLRNYLTKEIIEDNDLFLYKKVGYDWKVTDKDWEKVRDQMVANMTNCGYPYIVVEDGDYNMNGELYIKHLSDGEELDIYYLERTLPYVNKLWGRPVHIETMLDNNKVLFTYEGQKASRKYL